MKQSKFVAALGCLTMMLAANSAQAYTTHFGVDLNGSSSEQPLSTANSRAAQTAFLSKMTGVRTENFEGYATDTAAGTSGLGISFTGAGSNSISATLQGAGSVLTNIPGASNLGRYSIPGGVNYWNADLANGSFSINFGSAIAAFGFFGTDIGDFAGKAVVEIYNGANLLTSLTVNNPIGNDGSALYYGFIAQNTGELFTSIKFKSTVTTDVDLFGFDGFTIAEAAQLTTTLPPGDGGGTTPEPTSLALAGLALAAAGFVARRRKN